MTAAPHLDAPTRPIPGSADSPPPATQPPTGGNGGRTRRRALLPALAALLVLGAGVTIQQARSAEAGAAAERAAAAEFAGEVEASRTAIADPARSGQNAASALLRHQLLVLAGDAPDASIGERLVAQLRTAADELEDAAGAPAPQAPDALPAEVRRPVLDRLAGVGSQATDVADTFRAAADDAEAWLEAVRDLDTAALAYAGSTEELPSGDDPEAIAAAWRAEGTLLDDYAAALDAAGDHEASAVLAGAHRQLVDGMRDVAADALTALEAEDVDGYNALLAERLGGEDPFGFADALDEARAQVGDAAVDGPLEDARARALGLLTELEELRRATPPRLAEVA